MNEAQGWLLGVILLSLVWQVWQVWPWRQGELLAETSPAKEQVARGLRLRSEADCPDCQSEPSQAGSAGQAKTVRPWREVKSRRGAPKRVKTEGWACPHRGCKYYGITDERVHALVGYGRHGQGERIQDFRCQACGTKVSERWGTPLYRLKTSVKRIGEVLTALVEGLDVSAAERVFGHSEGTLRTQEVAAFEGPVDRSLLFWVLDRHRLPEQLLECRPHSSCNLNRKHPYLQTCLIS